MTDNPAQPSSRELRGTARGVEGGASPQALGTGVGNAPPAPILASVVGEARPASVSAPRTVPPRPKTPAVEAIPQEPVRWRELAAVGLLVLLADLMIYRGYGFAGYGLLFVAAPGLLMTGAPQIRLRPSLWLVWAMLALVAARLVWCGSALPMAVGFVLLVAFARALTGLRPYVPDIAVYALQTLPAGLGGLLHYGRSANKLTLSNPRVPWANVVLPLAALFGFGTIFILANPDLVTSVTGYLREFFTSLGDWLLWLLPDGPELLLWGVVAWLAVGLLRPIVRESVLVGLFKNGADASPRDDGPAESPLYAALRNTLVAVIVLFAVYLGFEFKTLWFQVFPEGFYYAGYAHEGAAWLTVALALATLVLSAIFRGRVLCDPRLPRLRRLAWIWSAENLVLALAVYHRLFIYIGFNGMTRMRTVGLFGISAVLVGFVLVVWKIIHKRDFVWLIERQLWTLALAVYLFALTPVDALVHRYNVERILAGDPAPSVQISVHPIDSEGILVLPPLADCQDSIIREGVLAMLAQRATEAESLARAREEENWTSYQLADRMLLEKLQAVRSDWSEYLDPVKRSKAIDRFKKYAYQWY